MYSVQKNSLKDIPRYFFSTFPKKVRELSPYILTAFGIFLMGAVISILLSLINTDFASYFLPPQMIENINWDMTNNNQWNYPLMSSRIMINNILVSFKAFVWGITLGLGTIFVLFLNGTLLGALTGLIYQWGNPLYFWSLILPHGIIELSAIFISGGAGLMIGRAIFIPGKYTRKHALIAAAKEAALLLPGVVVLLVIAGIIEGFFTPLPLSPIYKLTFAALTALGLFFYIFQPYQKSND
jgi:uncharacterized membrane protein SpoIIM required for sporulation